MYAARNTRLATLLVLLCGILLAGQTFAEPRFAEGRILVKPAPGLKADKFEKLLQRFERRAKVKRKIKNLPVHVVDVPPRREKAMVRALANNPHIAFAELDQLVAPDVVVNDPDYGRQWHLPLIGAPDAWSISSGEGVIVAVLDSGVNANHVDLSGQVLRGWNTVSNNTDSSDINNHGTWVAGVIAAKTNNLTGVASTAPGAKILPVRITNSSDGWAYFSEMAEGIRWAADNGAKVANLSFNGAAGSSTVANAAAYMMSRGGIVTVAAGNDNTDYGYFNHASLFVAGATTSSDARASYSNHGGYVDISAPGSGIYTTSRNGGYSNVSGTSFAAPNVAAVAALAMAVNPGLLPTDVLAVIGNSSVDLGPAGWDPEYGHGRLDAAAATALAANVTTSDTTAPTVDMLNPASGQTVSGLVDVQVEAIDAFGVATVELLVDGVPYASSNQGLNHVFSFSWDSESASDGPHTLRARAVDSAGNTSVTAAVGVTVTNSTDDEPPVARVTSPGDGASGNRSVMLSASASDNVGVTRVSLYAGGKLRCAGSTGISCGWNIRKVQPGNYTIRAVAEDAAGNRGVDEVSFTVVGKSGGDTDTGSGKGNGRGKKNR